MKAKTGTSKRTLADHEITIYYALGKLQAWSHALDHFVVRTSAAARIKGRALPGFCIELQHKDGGWRIKKWWGLKDGEWRSGDREQVETAVLAAVTEWVSRHPRQMRSWGLSWLKWKIDHFYIPDGAGRLCEAVSHAILLNRVDLLKPLEPLITESASKLSHVAERFAAA
jgi:hypothetical protein